MTRISRIFEQIIPLYREASAAVGVRLKKKKRDQGCGKASVVYKC